MKFRLIEENLKELNNDIVIQYANKFLPRGDINSKRAFISPDGIILDVVNNTHDKSSLFICNKLSEDGYDIDSFINKFDNCIQQELLDRLGFIHVNSQNEDYILLPPSKINRRQSFILGDWIENFFKDTNYKKSITVMAYNLNTLGKVDAMTYSPNDYDGDEVASRAIRYYNTGRLFEAKR